MEYDYQEMPLIAENIWHAQMAGWERILTYDLVTDSTARKKNRSGKRNESIVKAGVIRSRKHSADEYPFASTVENGGSVFIGHAPEEEQRKQGGLISGFYSKHKQKIDSGDPFHFEVRVKNFPIEKQVAATQKPK